MFNPKNADSRLVETETENRQLRREIATLKRENAELKEKNNYLRHSLDESTRYGPQPGPRYDRTSDSCDSELQRKLAKTSQQLASVQERLSIMEQVTAATQRRELQQEGVCENLPPESVYEELRFEEKQEHVYASLQQTTHADVLRERYRKLTTKLDAHLVAVHMFQRNALTLRELQSIQSLRDRPVEAAETLLNIIMEQPDAVYLCFLDVLKHADTGQQHIYQTLVQDTCKDYDYISSHTVLIREHYVYLLETLDVKFSGLLSHLLSAQVINAVDTEVIGAEQTSFRANEKLLSVLSRKSPQQFQLFLDALDSCGQQHVRETIASPREGDAVQMLPEGPPVHGVTILGKHVCVLRGKERDQVEMYDVITYHLLRCLTVPNARGFVDMTSCEHFLCLYISGVDCIHRLDLGLEGNARHWPVSGELMGLSVNSAHNLIVVCIKVRKIKEFDSFGELLREITLPCDIIHPRHAVELTSGQFVVCHGHPGDPVHRVSLVSADGSQTIRSYGGQPGADTGQLNAPIHLAVDDNEYVFVVDYFNQRVTLLSPTLSYARHVLSSDKLKWWARRLHLDVRRRRLYVIDSEWKEGALKAGRILVLSV